VSDSDLPRDAKVIRFRPTEPTSVLNSAIKAYRATKHAVLSVFASPSRPGEALTDTHVRLVVAASMTGLNLNKNKYYWHSTAGVILDAGFVLAKEGYEGEVPEHYAADLGEPTIEAVNRFLAAFEGPEATA